MASEQSRERPWGRSTVPGGGDGTEPLVFVEVQVGGHLGEDHIERTDDFGWS